MKATIITSEQRHALTAVLAGEVRLGVEENLIHPVYVSITALKECFAQEYCRWNVRLPGGRAKLTDAGVEAMG